jgi:hypothetical protein
MQLIIGFRLTLELDVHLQDTKLLYFKKNSNSKKAYFSAMALVKCQHSVL